jgi:hypothetical protein
MKHKYILGLLLFVTTFCEAQRVQVVTYRTAAGDSTKTKKEKKARRAYHYLGIQANQLLNQLFNFGNSTTAVSNPYLIIYSINSIPTGWGLNVGTGYAVNTSTDNSNPNVQNKSTLNDFSLRLGVEKKSFLSRKWMASYGFDFLWSKQSDETTSTSQFQFQTNITDTNSSTRSFGSGPRVGLNYFISEKIMLGTEATYYFRWMKVSSTITNTSMGNGADSSSANNTNQHLTDLTLNVPVAIFLIVKL